MFPDSCSTVITDTENLRNDKFRAHLVAIALKCHSKQIEKAFEIKIRIA